MPHSAPNSAGGGVPTEQTGTKKRARSRMRTPVVTGLTLLVVVLVLTPFISVIRKAFFPFGSFDISGLQATVNAPWFGDVMVDTFIAVSVSCLLATSIAAVFAWANERTDASLGLAGDILPLVPLLLPAVAMAIGWTLVATPDVGLLVGALEAIGLDGLAAGINIYSWPGLILVLTLELLPYAYVIISAALRNVDSSLEEASRINGAGLWRTLRKISIPAIRPALINALLLTVIVGVAVYSVPAVIGARADIDLLSVRVIRMLTFGYPPDLNGAVSLGFLMFIIIVAIWLLQQRVVAKSAFATIGGRGARPTTIRLGSSKWLIRSAMMLYIALAAVIPILGIVLVSFQPFWTADVDLGKLTTRHYEAIFAEGSVTQRALFNSVTFAVVGALIGMLITAVVVIGARRRGGRRGKSILGMLKLPAASSNVVLALGILLAFSGPPINLAGTATILILAYIITHLPQSSVSAESAAAQVGSDMIEASYVSGAGTARTTLKVQLPLMLPGLTAGCALLFVLFAGDVSVSMLLSTAANPVVGPTILGIYENGTYGQLAALSAVICAITTAIVAAIFITSRLSGRGRPRTGSTRRARTGS